MKSVALHNLGCKVNSYEVDVMQQNLQENGFLIVPFDEIADIYIVNTCTVTNIADQKSRKMLHRARQKNPDAIVVAVGCFVQTEEETLKDASIERSMEKIIDLAVGNNKKNELVQILNEYILNRRVDVDTVIDINRETEYEEMSLKQIRDHTRAFVKIQDGCNQFCSYCIIPHVRGRVRSRAESAIIDEVNKLNNVEIVLTGINLSSYGSDFNDENALINLLEKLVKIPGLIRIRLGSLEPRLITAEFAEKMADMPKICPHFHLSLQSGCDETLKRMNRHYNTAEYFEKTGILRAAYRKKYGDDYEPALTTDVIVGFPGETEEEFLETENFIKKVDFFETHVFKYSKRKGTAAADMPNQIPAAVKKERSNRLIELSKIKACEYRRRFIGRKVTVILEEIKVIKSEEYWLGYTGEYVRVGISVKAFAEKLVGAGHVVMGVVTGFLDEITMGIEFFE